MHNLYEDGVEKYLPRDHRLSPSLVMPIGEPKDGFYISRPHTYDRFLYVHLGPNVLTQTFSPIIHAYG